MLSDRCLSSLSVCLSVFLSVLSCLLRSCTVAKRWTDQDETWHARRPRPWPHCVRLGPNSPPPKGHNHHPIFGPYLLRPNGCMYQDSTWYGGRPQPRGLCVRWGPSPKFVAHVYYSYCDFVRTLHNAQSLIVIDLFKFKFKLKF